MCDSDPEKADYAFSFIQCSNLEKFDVKIQHLINWLVN